MKETLTCEFCHNLFIRTIQRGRKPRLCSSCQYFGVRLPPRPTITTTHPNLLDTQTQPSQERSDCTVRALATATDHSYQEAYELLAKAGRRPEKGFNFNKFVALHHNYILGHYFISTPLIHSRGIRTALLRNPQLNEGTWVLQQPGHVTTLRDGTLIDSFDSTRKDIRSAWKVTSL